MSRPIRPALIAAGAALALAATAGAPHAAPAHRTAATDAPVILHWKAKPRGGDGANVQNEQWLAMTKYPEWHIVTTNLTKAKRSSESWDGPRISARADGPPSAPLAERLQAGEVNCSTPSATQLAAQRDYSATLRSLWVAVDELRTDSAKRAALPAGPKVGGRATVEALIYPAPTQGMSPPATYVDFDADSGAVLRTREAEDFGSGPRPGPSYQDYSTWELQPATKARLAKVQPPAAVTARCK